MSSPSCIFLIHLLACPCGSIIKGHLVPLVTKMAESVDTCKITRERFMGSRHKTMVVNFLPSY